MADHRLRQTSPGRVEVRESPSNNLCCAVLVLGFGAVLLIRELSGGPIDDGDDVFELALAGMMFFAALVFLTAGVAKLVRPRLVADASGVGRPGDLVPWPQVVGMHPESTRRLQLLRAHGREPATLSWDEGVTAAEVAHAFAACARVHGHTVGVHAG